jgi:hypothetical protein
MCPDIDIELDTDDDIILVLSYCITFYKYTWVSYS